MSFSHVCRGDNINGFDASDRAPDPERLLGAYFHSATTLNYIRSLLSSNFASLNAPRTWSFSHVRSPVLQKEFEDVVDRLSDALDFMNTISSSPSPASSTDSVEIFTSHEGLSLEYEETLTRLLPVPLKEGETKRHNVRPRSPSHSRARGGPPGSDPEKDGYAYYNAGTHFIWIGDRTRQITGAHVE